MPDYAVGTKFTAKEQVTATYKRMGRAADKFSKRTSSAFRNASKEGYRFGTIVKGIISANLIRGAVTEVATGISTVTRGFLEFDDSVVAAFARFDDLGPKAKNAASGIASLKQQTIAAVVGTEHSLTSAGQALDFFAKANWNSKPAINSLTPMLDIATAAGEEFSETVDMTNDLLGAFGMRSKDSVKQIKLLARMSDVLTRSGLDANGGLRDFFETMKMIGPVATTVGADLENVSAMQVVLANAGIKGTKAATGLKHALLNIPGGKMAAIFDANDIEIEDRNGNIRNYIDILSEIEAKTNKLGNRAQANIFEKIFGLYGVASGAKILQSLNEVRESRDRLFNAGGVTKDVANFRREHSLQIKLMMLKNAALEKSFEVFESFKYRGKAGVEAMVEAIRGWNPKRLIDGLNFIIAGAKTFYAVVKPFLPMMPYLIAGFLAFNVTLKALQIGQTAMLMFRFFKAAKLAIGTMGALNLVMAANPIGLIAAAIAAVTIGVIYLEKKFGLFSTAFEFWGDVIKSTFNSIVNSKAFEMLSAMVMGVGRGLKAFGGIFFNGNTRGSLHDVADQSRRTPAPNQQEAASRNINFNGRLDISGAPTGSTVESKTFGAPSIDMNLMGANP